MSLADSPACQAPAHGAGSRQTALSKSAAIEMSDISNRSSASNLFDSGMSETSAAAPVGQ
jgi:hypothetical protein